MFLLVFSAFTPFFTLAMLLNVYQIAGSAFIRNMKFSLLFLGNLCSMPLLSIEMALAGLSAYNLAALRDFQPF